MSVEGAIANLEKKLAVALSRVEAVEKELAKSSHGGSAPSSSSSSGSELISSASVQDYDDLINQYIQPYVEHSNKIGQEVAEQAAMVMEAVSAQRSMLQIAASCKKPNDETMMKLLKPTSEQIEKITKIRDANRASKLFNHLSTISEGIGALGWVLVTPTPGPHVAEMRGASEFYSNKLLREFKGKDQMQVDWVTAFNSFLKELQVYIKKHHTTCLEFNRNGGDAANFSESSDSAPPPPPGPPPPMDLSSTSSSSSQGPDMANVFSAINQGIGISSGLKKVTADMKSKNRKDKTSLVSADAAKPQKTATKSEAKEVSRPPKLALEGNKWAVEYQAGNKNIVIAETEPKHTVYIYKCKDSVVQIKGKVNTITVDDCMKTAIVFENAIASFDVVNCRSIEIQVTGKVPNFSIDKTSGCQLYLSKAALTSEIVTSKSSEMNVLLPGETANDDPVEIAIPEQYKTTVEGGRLVTEVVQHV